jgi:dipeptidyl aminopeptidase/acylaminoacyl peptidase
MMHQAKQYTIEEFMHTIRMAGISFSHDERHILVTCNLSGVPNAFKVPVAGGPPIQLTFSIDEPIKALSFFPHDGRILYAHDKGGIENRHLCVLEENCDQIALSHGERVKSGFYGWSRDGRYFYCTTDERAENQFDVYRIDARSYERALLFQNDEAYLLACISPDERQLVLVRYRGLSDSDLYLYDVNAGVMQVITPHTGNVLYLPICFEDDSRYLRYRSDEDEKLMRVHRYDIQTGNHELADEWPNFRQICFSASGKYRAALLDEGGAARILLHDNITNQPVHLPSMSKGNVTSVALSRSDRLMGFYINGDRQPNELYVHEIASARTWSLTNNLNPRIDPEDLVESETIVFKSFDSLEIPCLLWTPHGVNSFNKAPALIWVHGGPVGQVRSGYAGAVQYLVNRGYVVLGVNHRGSTGYGKAFMDAADRRQGFEPLWDCVEAKRHLASFHFVDGSRIGIIGGSFGGYMALAALTFHPHEFAVGVSISGISNLRRHVETKIFDPHVSKVYFQKVGDPCKDREMLDAASPLLHVHNIVKPLMVIHGAKDPRADKAESDDIVKAVRARGGVVEYLEFADEAHGFRKRSNSIRAYEAVGNFLDRYLKDNVTGFHTHSVSSETAALCTPKESSFS